MPGNVSKQWNIQLDSALRAVPHEPLQDLNITLPQLSKRRQGERVTVGGEESKILSPGLFGSTLEGQARKDWGTTAESKAEVLR